MLPSDNLYFPSFPALADLWVAASDLCGPDAALHVLGSCVQAQHRVLLLPSLLATMMMVNVHFQMPCQHLLLPVHSRRHWSLHT